MILGSLNSNNAFVNQTLMYWNSIEIVLIKLILIIFELLDGLTRSSSLCRLTLANLHSL